MRTILLSALATALLGAQEPPPAPAPPPPSTLATPIVVDLGPMFAAAERNTPVTPPGVETWTNLPNVGTGLPAYRFNLYRDPLYFVVKGNRIVAHTTVNYWFEVGLRMGSYVKGMGSCGLPPEKFRRARLGIQAEVNLTPDWNLDLRLTPEEPVRIDGCQITFVGYDITDRVLSGMKDNLTKALEAMRSQIQDAVKLRARAEEAWRQALQPVELAPGVYLALNPERVRLAPWASQGKTLTLTPEIQVRPAITLGVRPEVAPRPLPPLDLSAGPIAAGLNLQVDADLSFEHAAKQMMAQVGGQTFETEKGKFRIEGVAIRAKDGFAYLDLDVRGRVDGRLTLKGRPVFDAQLGILRLEDLDYTLETQSLFTRFGEWLYRGTLKRTLSEKCGMFLDHSLKDIKEKTRAGLNRTLAPGVALAGDVDLLHVRRVDVLPDRFKVEARLEGTARLLVTPDLK
ncbi:DUF4403 family protein [Mesoterricola sediminis]|uniref:DUF4403 family protein n=1 Tax=Mesoterricola sediminis TaxID=2927980 RepID=A0AA48KD23_9BACT|nr:DUF4403 family protein [Mesoterricola sediminis]BDU77779.1 hypothetical protein METESE_27370 [Mesoterricola sediminis]